MQTTLRLLSIVLLFSLVGCGPKYFLNGTPTMEYEVAVNKSVFAMEDGEVSFDMQGMTFKGEMQSLQKTEERYEEISEDTVIHTILLDSTKQTMAFMGQEQVQDESNPLVGIPLTLVLEDDTWKYVQLEDLTPEQQKAFEELDDYGDDSSDELYPTEAIKIGESWETAPDAIAEAFGGETGENGSMTMVLNEVKEYKGHTCAFIGFSLNFTIVEDDGTELLMTLDGDLYRSLELYEDLEFSAEGMMSGTLEEGAVITLKGPLKVRYETEIIK